MSSAAIPAALARRRNYSGPALLSYGFRPFFLFGAAWSALAIILWLPQYLGGMAVPTAFAPRDWHVHEMLFGYVPAIVAGFLLTAIPNWTGRLPINGAGLAGLVALWLAGRLAIAISAIIGARLAAVIDLAFLACFAAVALREIVAGRNWRNLRVLAVLGAIFAGNALFHFEASAYGAADYGIRIGLGAVIMLIMLVGGRIVPSFTHNWISREHPGRSPRPFSRYDAVSMAIAGVSLAAWIAVPDHRLTGLALVAAGILQAVRLARWAGDRTIADRLVFVLHLGYAFVPVGFLLLGGSLLWPSAILPTAGIHAWGTGAIGLMTLAVMTRATLGHTGRALRASAGTQAIYAAAALAAVARILAPWGFTIELLYLASAAWFAAFAGFGVLYGPLLVRPRVKG